MKSQEFTGKQLQWIRKTLKIAVVHGGEKTQPQSYIYKNLSPRSTKTYQSVACDIALSLQESGFEHVEVLPEDIYLPLTLKELGIDLVIINSGGLQGFDPMCHLPSMLEMLGVPYVGHSPMTAGILDNKHLFKHKIHAAGIPTAPFITIGNEESVHDAPKCSILDEIESQFGSGFIVKPVSGRASIHVYPVFQRSQLAGVVEKVKAATNNTVMVEPYLSGREFVVAMAGATVFKNGALTELEQPFSFSILERAFSQGEDIFTSMDVKPITGERLLKVQDPALRRELVDIGCKIFTQLGLQTLVRVDLRMDACGNLFVLEANPKPDLKRPQGSELSIVCYDLETEGMSYNDLIQSLLFNRLSYLHKYRSETVAHCFNDEFYSLAAEEIK
ncbi:D-alanine--D-alanine ligase family protein [Psychromonas aquimarina]|uniref:D-alanine--D-alanine ligase family protein n=1 Tax=Psychromonas aquimarina TaxID=444919 RepID=UPI00041F8B91|nr:D-alanine--D-alanine ligase [Psychromonas aquimarina]